MSGLFSVFVLLIGTWAGLLRLLPGGAAYEVLVVVLGIAVAVAYLVLLVRHLRSVLGGRASVLAQIGCTGVELALLLAAFASIYQRLGILDNTQPSTPVIHDFWRSLYLSFITFTTVGYGDFYPTGVGRALAALEGLMGYLVLGILASTAASLLSPHAPEGPYDDGKMSSP